VFMCAAILKTLRQPNISLLHVCLIFLTYWKRLMISLISEDEYS
jgi:hypothetical protein